MTAFMAGAGSVRSQLNMKIGPSRLIDSGERLFLVVAAATFFFRLLPKAGSHPDVWFLLLSEILVISFVVIRPWNAPISTKPRDIILALLAVCLPLMVSTVGSKPHYLTFAGLIMTVGILLSVSGKIALNRRYGAIAANRGVQIRGPFRLIRHPIYAGYTITHIGFLVANPYWWNALLYALSFSLQVWRIFVEEQVLRRDSAYLDYARRVRFRLVPGLF